MCGNGLRGSSPARRGWLRSGGEVKRDGSGGLLGQGLPAVDLAHRDLARSEQRPEQPRGRFRRRQHGLGLDPALELLVQPLDRIGRPRRLPLALRQAQESEQALAGLLQARRDAGALQPPLAQERLARKHTVITAGGLTLAVWWAARGGVVGGPGL